MNISVYCTNHDFLHFIKLGHVTLAAGQIAVCILWARVRAHQAMENYLLNFPHCSPQKRFHEENVLIAIKIQIKQSLDLDGNRPFFNKHGAASVVKFKVQ